jgi:DNA mismatch repair protein MutS
MPKASTPSKKVTEKAKETPLMQQFNSIKEKHPGALLLFRVGDFYETFGEDAVVASKILGIVLTKRANGSASHIELAGFPHHSIDVYLPKLVRAGQRVAICDQLEDPKMTKTIVKRGVTELVTPGVSYNDNILQQKSNNYLASVFFDKMGYGIAFLDISTGEFMVSQGNRDYIDKLLQSFKPAEVIFQRDKRTQFSEDFGDSFYTFHLDDWIYGYDYAYEKITHHFDTTSLKGFGIENMKLAIMAAGGAMHYIHSTHHNEVKHISNIARIEDEKYVWLDRFTVRNLELIQPNHEGGKALIDIIDRTQSPMGGRLLKKWMVMPLKEPVVINQRLEVVEYFVKNFAKADTCRESIHEVGDLERLISKVALAKVSPKEVVQLKRSLIACNKVKELSMETKNDHLIELADGINPSTKIIEKIDRELMDDPSAMLNKGNVISDGINEELDDLRSLAFSGKDYLLQIQKREIERTGITSLKVAFNNVFGYYLEVTNKYKDQVPEEWIRKQTLVNAERYITDELKVYEEKILSAEERILALETQIYTDLVISLAQYIQPIQVNAHIIANIDCLLSFASISRDKKYSKPLVDNSMIIDIKNGRHPVIECQLPIDEPYIPNDIYLDRDDQQVLIITGPNMSGKSAVLRQTALISIMAQMGCFVPASKATLGIVDKVFTRVGASDNISSGESTFMVEMNETASILNNISDRSLILLDEIGRGTSTYDGISLAWSIAEFIHNHPLAKAKTLFATHYHELNEMANELPRIKNFNVSIKEADKKIVFLRKLKKGGSEHSFGIHVAKLAGMPVTVIERSEKILAELEEQRSHGDTGKKPRPNKKSEEMQLSIFSLDDPKLAQIKEMLINLELNTLTPIDAMMKLHEIQQLLKKD